MQIEYDTDKRLVTLAGRGIDFADFPLVFSNRLLRRRDPFRKERRWQIFGYLGNDLILAVYVIRRHRPYSKNYRVLSMRKVGTNDREKIEETERLASERRRRRSGRI